MTSTPGFGQPSRRVFWLVKPSAFDEEHMPSHFTLMYELTEPFGSGGYGRPGRSIIMSPDQEEVAKLARQLHCAGEVFEFHTYWYNELGHRVSKPGYVRMCKMGLIA